MKLKRKTIFITLFVILFIFFCFIPKYQKIYVFDDINGKPADFFTEKQLKDLEKNNAIMALSIGGQLYNRKENVNFHVFSKNNFSTFTVNYFTIQYDEISAKVEKKIRYIANTNNPNFEREKTYNSQGKTIKGFEKEFYGGYENFETCWIDFYSLFKHNHRKINEKFNVTIIVSYYLDDCEYTRELNYIVECIKIPYNLLYRFLSIIPHI